MLNSDLIHLSKVYFHICITRLVDQTKLKKINKLPDQLLVVCYGYKKDMLRFEFFPLLRWPVRPCLEIHCTMPSYLYCLYLLPIKTMASPYICTPLHSNKSCRKNSLRKLQILLPTIDQFLAMFFLMYRTKSVDIEEGEAKARVYS